MTTLDISLPDSMLAYIDQMVAQGGYRSASEFICQLVREDQKRDAQKRLEDLLEEGIDSGERLEGSAEYWAKKRAELSDDS